MSLKHCAFHNALGCVLCKPEPRPRKPRKPIARGRRPRSVRKVRAGRISIKTLDDLARPLCRARGVCEAKSYTMYGPAKGCSNLLQWAHVISRTYKTPIRWSQNNCLCLCSAHHKFFTDRPVEWRRFLIFKFGESGVYVLEQQAVNETKMKHDRSHTLAYLKAWTEVASSSPWLNELVIHP